MTYRTILKYPDARLKIVSEPVAEFNNDLRLLVDDLYDTLNVELAAGIAAPQINVHKRIVLIKCSLFDEKSPYHLDKDDDIMVLINPELELSTERTKWEEACLSVPGCRARISRSSVVRVKYRSIKGEYLEFLAGWPMAGAIQHECDHLDGLLYIDRLPHRESAQIQRKIFSQAQRALKRVAKKKKKEKKELQSPTKQKRKRSPKQFGKLKKRKKR